MPKTLVIVESPAKAKTIGQFLGDDYDVKASFGHVRDLPESASDVPEEVKSKPWGKLGVNVEEDFQPVYVVNSDKKRHVAELKAAAKNATRLLLATDEDREGESISWHILQLLQPKKSVPVQRIVFHEITPEAIKTALANPRDVDDALVRAQETRRILDRLYGYTLSPLLWKKVAPKLSAGRVQSVAVRLVVMRERERAQFVVVDYSGVTANLQAAKGDFKAKLTRIDNARVADGGSFNPQGQLENPTEAWLTQKEAAELADRIAGSEPWQVTEIEKKPGVENPPAPFMTSTLQQEANRKFGYTARRTMQIAQSLYEGVDLGGGSTGLITYMRTDSLSLAERAVQQARQVVTDLYGPQYLPKSPRTFKSKAKNAQEAHEAIRPTDLARKPQDIRRHLTEDQFKLYDLVWKRTLACQMQPAQVERTRVEISVPDPYRQKTRTLRFGASGKSIVFPGFLRAYVEGSDDPEAELGDKETILPELNQGEILKALAVASTDHQTKPPARYTEATLVRKLEEEGVGRPSTYASIIGTIQDRGYVFKQGNQLVPTFTAYAVTSLLEDHFDQLVDLRFTAQMEDQLDEIAEGRRDMVAHLRDFYYGQDQDPGILEKVEKQGPDIPFPNIHLGQEPDSNLPVIVRIGRNGPFVQRGEGGPGNTASVPEDLAPAELTLKAALELLEARARGPEAVGVDPASGQCVFAKTGRYGPYLEVALTPDEEAAKATPKRTSLPPGLDPAKISDEDLALLLSFPRDLGHHPESGDPVVVQIGRYGPYVAAGTKRANAGEWRQAAKLTLEAATALLAAGPARGRTAAPAALKEFGELPGCAGPVKLLSGRYGPYVTDGATNATIPKNLDPENLTPDQAAELIQARAALGPPKKKTARSTSKSTTPKSNTSKTTSKTTKSKSTKSKTTKKKKA